MFSRIEELATCYGNGGSGDGGAGDGNTGKAGISGTGGFSPSVSGPAAEAIGAAGREGIGSVGRMGDSGAATGGSGSTTVNKDGTITDEKGNTYDPSGKAGYREGYGVTGVGGYMSKDTDLAGNPVGPGSNVKTYRGPGGGIPSISPNIIPGDISRIGRMEGLDRTIGARDMLSAMHAEKNYQSPTILGRQLRTYTPEGVKGVFGQSLDPEDKGLLGQSILSKDLAKSIAKYGLTTAATVANPLAGFLGRPAIGAAVEEVASPEEYSFLNELKKSYSPAELAKMGVRNLMSGVTNIALNQAVPGGDVLSRTAKGVVSGKLAGLLDFDKVQDATRIAQGRPETSDGYNDKDIASTIPVETEDPVRKRTPFPGFRDIRPYWVT